MKLTNKYESYVLDKPKQIKHAVKTLTIFHQNIYGLSNKKELLHSLNEHPVHIICLTEHQLYDGEQEGMISNIQ